MTFHSSNRLEFPVVFVSFLEALSYMKDDFAGQAKLLHVAMLVRRSPTLLRAASDMV